MCFFFKKLLTEKLVEMLRFYMTLYYFLKLHCLQLHKSSLKKKCLSYKNQKNIYEPVMYITKIYMHI